MALATQNTGRSRARLSALPFAGHASGGVEIVENPIIVHDPQLAAEVEEEVHRLLRDEDLGSVQVRFRVCRDDADGLKFICKVENPPRVDGEGAAPCWRWWSPLLETAQEFGVALEDGLRLRRHRLAFAAGTRR